LSRKALDGGGAKDGGNTVAGADEVVALDATDGSALWRRPANVGYAVSSLSVKHGVLLVGNTAFGTADGKELWKMGKRGSLLPVLNDQTAYFVASGKAGFENMALDLLTGRRELDEKERPWTTPRFAKSCGVTIGSRNLLAFRSWDLAYCDLSRGSVRESYPGVRPGCFINYIPAGGLLLMPYEAECGCNFNIARVALQGENTGI
jgi:hypothetical protein